MNHRNFYVAVVACACAFLGCNGSDSGQNSGAHSGTALGGSNGSGGSQAARTTSKTEAVATGGTDTSEAGGSSSSSDSQNDESGGTVGSSSSSKHSSTGGLPVASGGSKTTGSKTTGGASNTATTKTGENETGGKVATGGSGTTGGASASGGRTNSGGTSSATKSAGGTSNAGGSQASGGTSSGSDSTYVPCAASPCKVLPLGDSITHGLQSSDSGGYRSQLFKLVLAGNQTLTFLGSQTAGPASVSGMTFPKNHEGYDGYPIDSGTSTYGTAGISSVIPKPAFNTIPDIVLLHIGTNDITSTGTLAATTSTRLDALLGKIVAAAPKALIIVAQIIPVNYTSADLDNYNSKIPGLVQARVAKGEHIISVDMSKMPKTNLAADKVHPNDQGYAYMANVWYTALKPYLR